MAPSGSWSQHVRFWCPTWLPKTIRNRYFFDPQRQLMLRCVKNKPKCFRTHAGQCFVASGPPNKAPEIIPTSMENRSQEPSMLRPVVSARQNRLPSLSRTILRRFFEHKVKSWASTWVSGGVDEVSFFVFF